MNTLRLNNLERENSMCVSNSLTLVIFEFVSNMVRGASGGRETAETWRESLEMIFIVRCCLHSLFQIVFRASLKTKVLLRSSNARIKLLEVS